jgi:hypothetical protein
MDRQGAELTELAVPEPAKATDCLIRQFQSLVERLQKEGGVNEI